MSEDAGHLITVEGRMDPTEAGVTLPHEHLFANWQEKFESPDDPGHRDLAHEPISLENLWFVRRYPSKHLENLRLDSHDDAVSELTRFADAGGDTLVDVTPKSVGSDPKKVRRVARQTSVSVIHGTAFYYQSTHPERIERMSVQDLKQEFISDVRDGINDTGIRAGLIGEIGTSTETEGGGIHRNEKKVLRGAAQAAVRTGAAVSVHPPSRRDPEYPPSKHGHDIVDTAVEEGLPPEQIIICHMDQSKYVDGDMQTQLDLARRGAYVEFDLFGHDRYIFAEEDAQPSDLDRTEYVRKFVNNGLEDRLLLSHDIFTKHKLTRYGGNGYSYLLDEMVPILENRGIAEETVERLLKENPKEILTFEESR